MPKRILLADDSITIQKVVELTFSDGDYEIVTANNGARALQKLSESIPDIILSDIIMPERNGYEVCEYVKSHPQYRNIPVILLTGTFEPFDPDRAEKAGCDAVVTKPFESQALINKVEELIDARRRADEDRKSRATAEPPQPPTPEPVAPAWNIPTFTPFPGGSSEARPAFMEEAPFGGETWSEQASPPPQPEAESPFAAPPPEGEPPFAAPVDTAASPEPAETDAVFETVPEVDETHDAETRAFPLLPTEPSPDEPIVRDIEEGPWSEPEAASAEEPLARTLQFPAVNGEWEAPPSEEPTPIAPETFISSWSPEKEAERPEPLPTQAIPVPPSETEEAPAMHAEAPSEQESVFESMPEDEPETPAAEEFEPSFEAASSFEETIGEEPAVEDAFAPAEEPPVEEEIYAQPPPLDFPPTDQAPLLGVRGGESQPGNGLALSESDIDRIARRVVELMSDQLVRNIAWEVIPDVAEAVVRERVRELEEKA